MRTYLWYSHSRPRARPIYPHFAQEAMAAPSPVFLDFPAKFPHPPPRLPVTPGNLFRTQLHPRAKFSRSLPLAAGAPASAETGAATHSASQQHCVGRLVQRNLLKHAFHRHLQHSISDQAPAETNQIPQFVLLMQSILQTARHIVVQSDKEAATSPLLKVSRVQFTKARRPYTAHRVPPTAR